MAIADITKPMALDETLQATNGKIDSVITKLQGIIDALGLDPSVYKPAGSKTCEELLPALLIADNLGNVYNITDSGTTTSDFVEGSGKPIPAGSNVSIVDVGTSGSHVYKFDLLAGMIDLTNYVQKSATAGLIKNDGTIDQKNYAEKPSSSTSGNLASLDDNGNLADSEWKSDKTTTAVSGNPISISGLKSNQLAINPIITFEPIQAGSGDPSPVNERPISGYDKIEVLSCGKNLFDKSKALSGKAINNTGTIVDSEYFYLSDFIPVKPNVTYYLTNGVGSSSYYTSAIFTKNKEFISTLDAAGAIPTSGTMPIPSNAYYIRLNVPNAYIDSCQFEEGSVATTYEPYHKTTDLSESLGQTVYGGSLDVRTGKLTVDRAIVDLGDFNWEYSSNYLFFQSATTISNIDRNIYWLSSMYDSSLTPSSGNVDTNNIIGVTSANILRIRDTRYTDATSFKTAVTGQTFCYKLAAPFTIQLTPHEISLLKDYAYVSTNGTNIALDYHNGELASLSDVSQLGETVNTLVNNTTQVKLVNIPYSNFSWDSNSKSFYYYNVALDKSRLLGFLVHTTNGRAILGAYYSSSIYVYGWLPTTGASIDGTYQFECYAIYRI